MAYKSIEKKRAWNRAYYAKHKDEPQWMAQRRRWNNAYNATHKELRAAYRATHKEERVAYYKENKEELNRNNKEYYQKNKASVIQRTKKYHEKNIAWYKEYHKNWYAKVRQEVLAKIDPAMKCAMCGCEDTRFLEVNHIKGGGVKERKGYKGGGDKLSHNMILIIHNGKRGVEDLNLLCRACNSIDHLERQFGNTGLKVVWDKPVFLIGPFPSLIKSI